jgi:hypothetical protein
MHMPHIHLGSALARVPKLKHPWLAALGLALVVLGISAWSTGGDSISAPSSSTWQAPVLVDPFYREKMEAPIDVLPAQF